MAANRLGNPSLRARRFQFAGDEIQRHRRRILKSGAAYEIDDGRIRHPSDKMLGDLAVQGGIGVRKRPVRDEDDLAGLLLSAPQPVAAALQRSRKAMPQEVHLFIGRYAAITIEIARFGADQRCRSSVEVNPRDIPAQPVRLDEDGEEDWFYGRHDGFVVDRAPATIHGLR
jgi:hypothetical protein